MCIRDREKEVKPGNGYMMIALAFIILAVVIGGIAIFDTPIFLLGALLFALLIPGFFIVNPNGSKVLTLFGEYKGTVKANGFFWANPFYKKQKISLRARNFDSERLKVNDKLGNPVLISVILVWRVKDTYRAAFDVDKYEEFVRVQTDAAVRKLSGRYAYDNFDELNKNEVTLRSGLDEVNDALEDDISERMSMAGIEVLEARIGYLAYAPEIASSMLKRQQAVAIVAARKKIVEGAVGMVQDALEKIAEDDIVEFDNDKKASMVSNLMIVLCGEKDVTPVINTGTLNG